MKKIVELLRQHASSTTTVFTGFTTGLVALNSFFLYQNAQARQSFIQRRGEQEPFRRQVLFCGNMAIDSACVESALEMVKPRPK